MQDIPNADYLLAEQLQRVLYVEDFTDRDILAAWASVVNPSAARLLSQAFVKHTGNVITQARKHFDGLRAAVPTLKGLVLVDQTAVTLQTGRDLRELMWQRREIENYLLHPAVICRLTSRLMPQDWDLLAVQASRKADELLRQRMTAADFQNPLADSTTLKDIRGSAFLEEFFRDLFKEFGLYNVMPKWEFYRIAAEMKPEEIHPEVIAVLDTIVEVLRGQTSPEDG